jgi:hypothetical protein
LVISQYSIAVVVEVEMRLVEESREGVAAALLAESQVDPSSQNVRPSSQKAPAGLGIAEAGGGEAWRPGGGRFSEG